MDRRTAKSSHLIRLGGREVEYRFVRRRRRTLGITVDAGGLKVSAPLRAPWRDIEGFVREKERWILSKLDEWARAPRPTLVRSATGERLPLFGTSVRLERCGGPARREDDALRFGSMPQLVQWLKATALCALRPRVAHFAARVGRPAPRVALSNARTQWGACNEGGGIRLSWRLVHVEPALADYVVAHEAAHLVELNHSERFYRVLASLYPDWLAARERLELAGAALPVLKETR
ncbi:MAG TPA: SprT family zinc-dependent metalloprotease [Burkholderiales bacterium]|nr:SprT family zinc-dependent metalloprotease [Burkholderiales bacterium]